MSNDQHIVRGATVAGTNDGSFAPHRQAEADDARILPTDAHPMATLTFDDFLCDDELEFARETLGPDATDDEVVTLAADRAQVAYDEYLTELDLRFPQDEPADTTEAEPEWRWHPDSVEKVTSRADVKVGDQVRCYMIGLGVRRALLGATGTVVSTNGRINAKIEFRGPLRNDEGNLVLRDGDVAVCTFPYQLLLRHKR